MILIIFWHSYIQHHETMFWLTNWFCWVSSKVWNFFFFPYGRHNSPTCIICNLEGNSPNLNNFFQYVTEWLVQRHWRKEIILLARFRAFKNPICSKTIHFKFLSDINFAGKAAHVYMPTYQLDSFGLAEKAKAQLSCICNLLRS